MEKKIEIPIKSMLKPAFYDEFHCLAGDCRDTCCAGWRISFDKKDYLRMRREDVPEAIKARLDQSIERLRGEELRSHPVGHYAKFRLDDTGLCLLRDPDGLCALQKAYGHDALPLVCRSYPRADGYTTAAREFALSPACEGVLELLWKLSEGVDFIESPLDEKDKRIVLLETDKPELSMYFEVIRSLSIDILQNRAQPLAQRMLLLGIAVEQLCAMDWSQPDVEGWVNRFFALSSGDQAEAVLGDLAGNHQIFIMQNLTTLLKLQLGGYAWAKEYLEAMGVKVQNVSESGSADIAYDKTSYDRYELAVDTTLGDIEYFYENLMVSVCVLQSFPKLESKEALWKSYVNLCNLYSIFRFAGVAGCGETPSKARFFHALVQVSRALLHNEKQQMILQDEFFDHSSDTLAHMAVLLCG